MVKAGVVRAFDVRYMFANLVILGFQIQMSLLLTVGESGIGRGLRVTIFSPSTLFDTFHLEGSLS